MHLYIRYQEMVELNKRMKSRMKYDFLFSGVEQAKDISCMLNTLNLRGNRDLLNDIDSFLLDRAQNGTMMEVVKCMISGDKINVLIAPLLDEQKKFYFFLNDKLKGKCIGKSMSFARASADFLFNRYARLITITDTVIMSPCLSLDETVALSFPLVLGPGCKKNNTSLEVGTYDGQAVDMTLDRFRFKVGATGFNFTFNRYLGAHAFPFVPTTSFRYLGDNFSIGSTFYLNTFGAGVYIADITNVKNIPPINLNRIPAFVNYNNLDISVKPSSLISPLSLPFTFNLFVIFKGLSFLAVDNLQSIGIDSGWNLPSFTLMISYDFDSCFLKVYLVSQQLAFSQFQKRIGFEKLYSLYQLAMATDFHLFVRTMESFYGDGNLSSVGWGITFSGDAVDSGIPRGGSSCSTRVADGFSVKIAPGSYFGGIGFSQKVMYGNNTIIFRAGICSNNTTKSSYNGDLSPSEIFSSFLSAASLDSFGLYFMRQKGSSKIGLGVSSDDWTQKTVVCLNILKPLYIRSSPFDLCVRFFASPDIALPNAAYLTGRGVKAIKDRINLSKPDGTPLETDSCVISQCFKGPSCGFSISFSFKCGVYLFSSVIYDNNTKGFLVSYAFSLKPSFREVKEMVLEKKIRESVKKDKIANKKPTTGIVPSNRKERHGPSKNKLTLVKTKDREKDQNT